MMKEVCADLQTSCDLTQDSKTYQSKGRAQVCQAMESHSFQRSNKVDKMMDRGAEDSSAYATVGKRMMMKTAKSSFGYQ